MARSKRPEFVYHEAAKSLATNRGKPQYGKYVDYQRELTPQEKAAISRAMKWAKRPRTDAEYIQSAKELSKFAPVLKRFKRRSTTKPKKLTPGEKGIIARKENLLKYHVHQLRPLNKTQIKEFKGHKFGPGVNAIEFRNTSPDTKVRVARKDLVVTSNGRDWLYWKLDRFDTETMANAAQTAFDNLREAFPIERLAALVGKAFESADTIGVSLWAKSGRVGEVFDDLEAFMEWLQESYGGYNEPDKWVRGIAIELG